MIHLAYLLFRLRSQKLAILLPVLLLATGTFAWQTATNAAHKKQENTHLGEALRNGKTLYYAAMNFAAEKGHYPNAATWEKDLTPYLPKDFAFVTRKKPFTRFALNPHFSNRKAENLFSDGSQAIVFFESASSQSAPHDDFVSLAAGKNSDQDHFVLVQISSGTYSYPRDYAQMLDDPKGRVLLAGK